MEVGNTSALAFPFTSNLINWETNPSVTPIIKKIIGFRNNSYAIRRGTLTSYNDIDVCAFTKTAGNQLVFVVANLRNEERSFTLPSSISGTTMIMHLQEIQSLYKDQYLYYPINI